jgi:hypothetical protein
MGRVASIILCAPEESDTGEVLWQFNAHKVKNSILNKKVLLEVNVREIVTVVNTNANKQCGGHCAILRSAPQL